MSSTFHIAHTTDNIRKSFIDFERETLENFTIDQLAERLKKGEDLFFTKEKLVKLKEDLSKSDIEGAESITESLKKLKPIIINKSDTEYEVGYLLNIKSE